MQTIEFTDVELNHIGFAVTNVDPTTKLSPHTLAIVSKIQLYAQQKAQEQMAQVANAEAASS